MAVSLADDTIAAVMEENGVKPKDIPLSGTLRFFEVKGFASFNSHAGCSRSWKSAHAWCEIDLKKQIISDKYTQDCQKCEVGVEPEFDDDAVRKMAEYAVNQYLIRSGRKERPVNPFHFDDMYDALDDRPPHDEGRCGRCKKLGRSCWKRQE